MKGKSIKKDRGFTIIEVMIVLAIAGLILAIIFLAVPSLQRNTRNNSRKNDATHLAGLVSEYAGNHAGLLPTSVGGGLGAGACAGATCLNLANENFAIMSGVALVNSANFPPVNTNTTLNINTGETCNPSTNGLTPGSSHSFSITMNIETSSGVNTPYCIPGS